MNAVKLLYLVVVEGGKARLLEEPHALEGEGLLRYGGKADLLETAAQAEPAVAVALQGRLIGQADWLASGAVPFDRERATVIVVALGQRPAQQRDPIAWLVEALLRDEVALTAPRPTPTATPRPPTAPQLAAAPERGLGRLLPFAIVALLVGLALGFWGRGALSSSEPTPSAAASSSQRMVAQAEDPEGSAAAARGRDAGVAAHAAPSLDARSDDASVADASARDASSADSATVAAAPTPAEPAPEPAPEAADSPPDTPPDSPPNTAPADAAPEGDVEPPPTPKAKAPPAPKPAAAGSRAAALALKRMPRVSLWRGEPLPSGVARRCNRHGDIELTATLRGRPVTRVVVCGLFKKAGSQPKAPLMRRSVCVKGPARCRSVQGTPRKLLPHAICTPKSGRAYPLRKATAIWKAGYRWGPQVSAAYHAKCGKQQASYAIALLQLKE